MPAPAGADATETCLCASPSAGAVGNLDDFDIKLGKAWLAGSRLPTNLWT